MEQKKNSESILIKVKKRSKSQRDHPYSYVDLSNLPLIDVYDNIIKKCQEKTKKVEDYFYILYVVKKKKKTHQILMNSLFIMKKIGKILFP